MSEEAEDELNRPLRNDIGRWTGMGRGPLRRRSAGVLALVRADEARRMEVRMGVGRIKANGPA